MFFRMILHFPAVVDVGGQVVKVSGLCDRWHQYSTDIPAAAAAGLSHFAVSDSV